MPSHGACWLCKCRFTCVSLSCDLVCQVSVPNPGAAPEPAGGIQTPGTDGPLSPDAACVAAPTTSPPHCSSERSSRTGGPPRRRAPCRCCGLRLDQGRDDVIVPLKSGVLAGLVWELEGRALWFYLWREKDLCQNVDIKCLQGQVLTSSMTAAYGAYRGKQRHIPARLGVSLSGLVRSSCPLMAWSSAR